MPNSFSRKSLEQTDVEITPSSMHQETGSMPGRGGDAEKIDLRQFLSPPRTADELGRLGQYRILKELGRGGMGMVLLAEDSQLRRMAALKIMLPKYAKNARARERFLREASSAARLQHDHIVTIFQVGEENGIPFIAMELLKGLSLDQYLKEKGELSIGQVLSVGREIAEGLQAAHAEGLIHRDIKPANIWLESPKGRVKILDFGLAREEHDEAHLTKSGAIIGTPAYMAPEQGRGAAVDARSDLFSLGVVLYRLTTGRLPFQGQDAIAVLTALANDTPTPVHQLNPQAPRALEIIINLLLAKKPSKRFQTAREVVDALAELEKPSVSGSMKAVRQVIVVPPSAPVVEKDAWSNIDATPSSMIAPGPPPSKSRRLEKVKPVKSGGTRTRMWLGVAIGIVALLIGGYLLMGSKNENKSEPAPQAKIIESTPKLVEKKTKEEPTLFQVMVVPPASRELVQVVVTPQPAQPMAPGTPFSPQALVNRPAAIKGVRRWTIETQADRAQEHRASPSPNGKYLALGALNGVVRLVDPATFETRRLLLGRSGMIDSLTWSPDGAYLAAALSAFQEAEGIAIWHADTGRLVRVIPMQVGGCHVVWSPDGQKIACMRLTGMRLSVPPEISIVDLATDKVDRIQLSSNAFQVTWSPDSKHLAYHQTGQGIVVRSLSTGDTMFQFPKTTSVAWSPDGKWIALAMTNGQICLHDASDGALVQTLTAKAAAPMHKIRWAVNGRYLAGMAEDGNLLFWNGLQPMDVVLRIKFAGNESWDWSADLDSVFQDKNTYVDYVDDLTSPKVRRVPTSQGGYNALPAIDRAFLGFTTSDFGTIGFDLATQTVESLPRTQGTYLLWSPDRKRAAIKDGGKIGIWDRSAQQVTRTISTERQNVQMWWRPDGQALFTTPTPTGFEADCWDVNTGERLYQFFQREKFEALFGALDADTVYLKRNDSLVAWDMRLNKQRWLATPYATKSFATPNNLLFFSPKQGLLAIGANGNSQFQIISPQDGRIVLRSPPIGSFSFRGLLWTEDEKYTISGWESGYIDVWEGGVKHIRAIRPDGNPVNHLCWFEPDKSFLVSSNSRTCQLVDFATGSRIGGALLLTKGNRLVVISPEGHYQGAASVDDELIYVAELDDGSQQIYSPKEFADKFGWKNDPSAATLNWKN